MKHFDYPRIRESYDETVLPNGLRIRVVHKPEFDKLYAMLAVNYGSMDLEYLEAGQRVNTPAGVAHYLEHKMFDIPEGNAMQRFSALGGSPNAFTGYGMTAYYVQTTQNPEENLRLLLEMVFSPYFTEESVEKERGIIAQEIKMYADSPDSRLFELLFEKTLPGHPLSVPIAGSVESIRDISAETLLRCYEAFYRPENMILCVEGNLSPERVVEIAESVELHQSARSIQMRQTIPAVEPPELGLHRVFMDVSMPMFAAGFRIPDISHGDDRTETVADLTMELLCGESTTLYQRLYEQGLIDSGFSSGYEGVRNIAMLSASGDSDEPETVLREICLEAERIRRSGIDPSDLERVKKALIGRRIRDLDSFAGTCSRLCDSFFDGTDCFGFPKTVASVTEADILNLMQYISEDRMTLVVIAPKEAMK